MSNTIFFSKAKRTGLSVLFAALLTLVAIPQALADATTADDECPDTALQQGLTQNARANIAARLDAGNEAMKSNIADYTRNPRRYYGSIYDTACLGNLMLQFNNLTSMTGGQGLLGNVLSGILQNLQNQVCNYARNVVETTLNNALNLMCIPIPELGSFSLNLPAPTRTSCNGGVSLANYMRFTTAPPTSMGSRVPSSYMGAPMSRMIDVQSGGGGFGVSGSLFRN